MPPLAHNVLLGRYFDNLSNKQSNKKYVNRKMLVTSRLQMLTIALLRRLLRVQFWSAIYRILSGIVVKYNSAALVAGLLDIAEMLKALNREANLGQKQDFFEHYCSSFKNRRMLNIDANSIWLWPSIDSR
jgi:hypothetical protein